MAKTGGIVQVPAGSFDGDLRVPVNVSLEGQGREATTLTGSVTVTGTTQRSAMEVDRGPSITGITFTGSGTCLRFEGVAYFSVERDAFRGCDVGVWFAGALQGRVDDSIFVGGRTGIRFTAEPIAYYTALPKLPPSRVLVEWSTFYENAWRAIDYSGGEQLLVEDSEFGRNGTAGDATSAAIWVEGAGDPPGPGLVGSGLWMESSHGLAALVLRGAVTHSIRDSWLAYTDATWAISQDGGTLVCDNVRMDALRTVTAVQGGSC